MSFEEEFDRTIRQKAEESHFPFDEKNWEKARAMLDADRKTGNRPAAIFYAVALILLSLGFASWVILAGMSDDSVPLNAQYENKSPDAGEAGAYQMTQMPVTLQQKVVADVHTPKAKTASVETPVIKRNTGHISASADVTDKTTGSMETENGIPAVTQNKVAEQLNTGETIPTHTDKNNAPAIEEPVASAVVDDMQAPVPANEAPVKDPVDVLVMDQVSYEPLSPVYSALPVSSLGQELQPVAFNYFNAYDEDYYKKKHIKTHFLNLEAGATYLAGWDVKGEKDGKGFNWFAGLNYGFYISKKIGVGAGLQLYNISHITKPFYTNSTTEYDFFGSTGTRMVITTNSLYYAALPLKVYYFLSPQSQFGAGLNIGMPVNARNTVETYGLSDNVIVNSHKTSRMGVYEGVNSANILLSAFYKTQVAKRLYVQGEIIYGVSDIFNGPGNVNNERAPGFRLSLQYTLFDK